MWSVHLVCSSLGGLFFDTLLGHGAQTWSTEVMWEVMIACVIMHNMIVEDERNESIHDQGWELQGELVARI
jgi:hypothetical protein